MSEDMFEFEEENFTRKENKKFTELISEIDKLEAKIEKQKYKINELETENKRLKNLIESYKNSLHWKKEEF